MGGSGWGFLGEKWVLGWLGWWVNGRMGGWVFGFSGGAGSNNR